jgi:lysophospholipase L1-like esterase
MKLKAAARRAILLVAVTVLPTGMASVIATTPAAAAPANRVLILEGTVSGGASSIEATEAAAQGMTVDIVTASTWSGMTTSQFAAYRAIILGDPTCAEGITADIAAATTNARTWGSAISGNIVIAGTDPVFHAAQGGETLTRRAVDFALGDSGKTGAYISLSCYYHGTAPMTPVGLLDGIGTGGFKVSGVGCYNNAHIVAQSPALSGLTDNDLSNWSCSVHEAFQSWPGNLVPLAIARDFDSSFTASDGSQGPPYILAGGSIKSFPLSITPLSGQGAAGSNHTVAAQLLDGTTRAPVAGAKLLFAVTSGPNSGAAGTCSPAACTTNSLGQVSWTYHSNGIAGDDTIRATYDVNGDGAPGIGEPQTTAGQHWTVATLTIDYVALGDSYSSGEGTFNYDNDKLAQQCHRGPTAWARIAGNRVPEIVSTVHKACSGAKTADLLTTYKGNSAQLTPGAPNSSKDLVTITIGGNDVGFGGIIKDCYLPGGTCADDPNSNGFKQKLANLKTSLGNTIYPALKRSYPSARLVHVGYPRITPLPGVTPYQCGWLGKDEQEAGVKLAKMLNDTIAAAAKSAGITFIDVTNVLAKHELCTKDSWMTAITLPGGSERGHPNIAGQKALALSIASQLGFSFLPEF